MKSSNIVSVSWADHLTFGEGDGRLASPELLLRRMRLWKEELGTTALHWRQIRTLFEGDFNVAPGYQFHPTVYGYRDIGWDDFEIVPKLAHKMGLKASLYVSLFDEGWPLASPEIRKIYYHNAMHGQEVSWQSRFSREHPEYTLVDRTGQDRQWGVLCLAYPEVRHYFKNQFLKLLEGYEWDGLFICLRSQSRPAEPADQFGFNEPIRQEFLKRYKKDILQDEFDRAAWRDLLSNYLTLFLSEMREALPKRVGLGVGCCRGEILGPPLGNTTLPWREWISQNLIDELVINQNSSHCPSMGHRLWPMCEGRGYGQDYRTGLNLPPLLQHLREAYSPVFKKSDSRLLVARQWSERSESEEKALLEIPAVSGLVFSSFRFDNPEALKRGDWRFKK